MKRARREATGPVHRAAAAASVSVLAPEVKREAKHERHAMDVEESRSSVGAGGQRCEGEGDESFEDELVDELNSDAAGPLGRVPVKPEPRLRPAPSTAAVSCVIDLTELDSSESDADDQVAAKGDDDSLEDEHEDDEEEEDDEDLSSVVLNFTPLSELGDKFYINRQTAERARDRDKEYVDMVETSLDEFEHVPFRRQLHDFLMSVWQRRSSSGKRSGNMGGGGGDETVRASYIHRIEARPAQCVDVRRMPNGLRLCPELVHALERQRKTSLYAHQFQVLDRLFTPMKPIATTTTTTTATSGSWRASGGVSGAIGVDQRRVCGRDVIITTPTSSGKSLCFNLGVFEKILRAKRQRQHVSGLYLFPLNALAKDQEKKLLEFNQQLPAAQRLNVVIMTGEHQTSEKMQLFRHSPPDILLYRGRMGQAGWQHWRTYLSRLGICVLDEAHTYSGIFGCNASNLIRRLYVAVDAVGGDSGQIQFILASATIGNPVDLASRLLHRPPTQADGDDTIAWVHESGAERPERAIITLESHSRSKVAAAAIIESWINLKWRSLVFCNTIDSVNKLRYFIQEKKRHISGRVRTYYSSMTPDAKAQVMRDLDSGKVLCVICSNALEAGLDLPGLDACLMLSHPGSKMSFWQRVGRAGRSKPGVAVFLPFASFPRDVYYASRPRVLLSEDVEKIAFNSDYPSILRKHVSCCAHESDLWWNERTRRFGNLVEGTVRELLEAKEVTLRSSQSKKGQLVQGVAQPWTAHRVVNMRGSLMEQVKVLWRDRGNVTLETLGKEQALWRAYPGAIFYTPDRSGKVQRFDVMSLELDPKNVNSHALLTLSTRKYCDTKAAITGKVEIKESWGEKLYQLEMGILTIEYGWGTVHTELYGYEERSSSNVVMHQYDKTYTDSYEAPYLRFQLSDEAKLYLDIEKTKHPQMEPAWNDRSNGGNRDISGGMMALHTFLHQMTAIVPLLLLAPHDVREGAYYVDNCEGFLVDSCSGGTGVCEMIYDNFMLFANKIPGFARSCTECRERTNPPDLSTKSLTDRCIQVVVSNLLDAQAAYAENGEVGEQDRPITSDPSLKVLPLDLLERIDNFRQEFYQPSYLGCVACISHDHCPLQNNGLAQGLGLKLVPLSEL